MKALFEQQGGRYQSQGEYLIPYLMSKEQKNLYIGVWAKRHRQYFKQHHRVRYYNLLTSEALYDYLADIEEQATRMFNELVKALTEKEGVSESLKAKEPQKWLCWMNNIRSRAAEIVNEEIIFK